MTDAILIAGGAGYIGSHCADHLRTHGYRTVILDDLSTGHRAAATAAGAAEFIRADIADTAALRDIFRRHRIAAVMHFAAFLLIDVSVANPAAYYRNNVCKTLTLLEAMREAGVRRFIFSSTCATFGKAQYLPIDDLHPQNPVNPYGASKHMVERVLADYDLAYGLKYAILRYFNACGADPRGRLGEHHDPETHLIPAALQAANGRRDGIQIYGDDYPTEDGTCKRDYIHVCDLAQAHRLALQSIQQEDRSLTCNLGTGTAFSVKQILNTVREITGRDFPVTVAPRRPGDPPELIADASAAKSRLNWQPRYTDLATIVRHAWQWEQTRQFTA